MAIHDVLNSGTLLKAFDVSDQYSRYENFEDFAQTINITFAVQQVFQRDSLEIISISVQYYTHRVTLKILFFVYYLPLLLL